MNNIKPSSSGIMKQDFLADNKSSAESDEYESSDFFENSNEESDMDTESEETDTSDESDQSVEIKVEFPNVWTDEMYFKDIKFNGNSILKCNPLRTEPIKFFNLLLDDTFFSTIISGTNFYGSEQNTNWKNVDEQEIQKFLGILFHTGIIKMIRIQDYWRKHKLFDLQCISKHMSKNRFLSILKNFHFSRNTHLSNRLDKINPIIEYFNNKMTEIYYPTKELCVEESTIPWRDRLKGYKHGIKLYELTDSSGITLKMKAYAKRHDDILSNRQHIENVVLQLLEDKLGQGHSVYMQKNYSSMSLTEKLLSQKTHCTGIIKKSRKGNCIEVLTRKLKKGEVIMKYSNDIMFGKWKDKNEILFISSEYSGEFEEYVNKRGIIKSKPKAIIEYNNFMKSIEKKNQMLTNYSTCCQKTTQWYDKIWIHVLETLFLNSFYLYKKYVNDNEMNLYNFRLNIIKTLLYKEDYMNDCQNLLVPLTHLPDRFAKVVGRTPRRRCRVCYRSKIRKDTSYYCPTCPDRPALCLQPCFKIFHSPNN